MNLATQGWDILPGLLTPAECRALRGLYPHPEPFRSTITMARHGFGQGEYKYFAYPLPEPIASLRSHLYAQLAPLANEWQQALGLDARFPATHAEYLAACHAAGQRRPTPLLLRYGPGDYNCLHQDVYGPELFPLQVAILLSAPGEEFTGGEFVLTEQRPRRQSRPVVVPLTQGDGVVFAVRQQPVAGARGHYRVQWRHGVSALRTGERYTVGIIFHDAE